MSTGNSTPPGTGISQFLRRGIMANTISVLCVHGIGHGEADPNLEQSWTNAITAGLTAWDTEINVTCDFLKYDDLFEQAPLNTVTYGSAFASAGKRSGAWDRRSFHPRARSLRTARQDPLDCRHGGAVDQ
jgi:hypothetical protein